jgi:hypothetical protein
MAGRSRAAAEFCELSPALARRAAGDTPERRHDAVDLDFFEDNQGVRFTHNYFAHG